MEVARHVQISQNRKMVIFLQYIKKSVKTAFFSTVMQNIQIFHGGPVMFVVACLYVCFVRVYLPNTFLYNIAASHQIFVVKYSKLNGKP